MLIVSGKIYLKPRQRKKFLDQSMKSVSLARKAKGCLDFVVAADPIEENRVNVFEMWQNEKSLMAFRESGPDDGLFSLIERAEVARHSIRKSGPA